MLCSKQFSCLTSGCELVFSRSSDESICGLRCGQQHTDERWSEAAVVCVVYLGNRSNHSNTSLTQLRFSYKPRVRMGVRGFEAFPNALGYTGPQRKGYAGWDET